MEQFLRWFASPGDRDPLLAVGLAHLWFVTIHPFEDGKLRIASAIADTLERTPKGKLTTSKWAKIASYSLVGNHAPDKRPILRP